MSRPCGLVWVFCWKLYNWIVMQNCSLCLFNEKKQCIEEGRGWLVDEPWDYSFQGLFFIRLKRHCESLAELTSEESEEIGGLIQKYSAKSSEVSNADRVLAMSLGLSDPHIHFWILPKTSKNTEDVLKIREAMRIILKRYKKK